MESLPERPRPPRPLSEVVRAWVHWFGVARLLVGAVAVLSVGAGAYWLLRAPATVVENTLPYATKSTTTTVKASLPPLLSGGSIAATSTSVEPKAIIVDVSGAVMSPGVYELASSARVHQAVDVAGGPAPDADLEALNLAATMHDGDRIFVPHKGHAVPTIVGPTGGASATVGTLVVGPVDLNQATAEQLDALPGVGPSIAAAIVAYRGSHGPFSSVDGLLDVPGIGPTKLDAIRALVTV